MCESGCGSASQCDELAVNTCHNIVNDVQTPGCTNCGGLADEKCNSACGYSSCDAACCEAAADSATIENQAAGYCTAAKCSGICSAGTCLVRLNTGYGDCDVDSVCVSGNCWQDTATTDQVAPGACDTANQPNCNDGGATDYCIPDNYCGYNTNCDSGDPSDYVASGTITADMDCDGDADYCLNEKWYDCSSDSQCPANLYCVSNDCISVPVPSLSVIPQPDKPLNSELGKMLISWSGSLPGGYQYKLEETSPSAAQRYEGTSTSYTHDTLEDNTQYCYRVRIHDTTETHY